MVPCHQFSQRQRSSTHAAIAHAAITRAPIAIAYSTDFNTAACTADDYATDITLTAVKACMVVKSSNNWNISRLRSQHTFPHPTNLYPLAGKVLLNMTAWQKFLV